MGSESAGLEQGSGDVVGEVPEAEGGSAEVFESAVDRFGGAVGRAGSVEVGEHVSGSLFQGAAERAELAERRGDTAAEARDQLGHQVTAACGVGIAVGGDHLLVGGPSDFDGDVIIVGVPRRPHPKKGLRELRITFEPKSWHPKAAMLTEARGDTTTITFGKLETNAPVDPGRMRPRPKKR